MHLPIFYSAMLLTLVNLILRFAGTGFQVYLSGTIGAAGVGLLQLVMSVGSFAIVAGVAGIRTGAMYLTADALGRGRKDRVTGMLSGCFVYSILFSTAISAILYTAAPAIADLWIRNTRTVTALRLFAAFLPVICLSNVMTGYFTAANRIGTLAAVEVAEQMLSMAITVVCLSTFAQGDPVKACSCVIFGSCCGACLTLLCLFFLRMAEKPPPCAPIKTAGSLARTALPLAIADVMRSGISTVENLMVPARLALCAAIRDPLAAFGRLSGMVFPILMFPAALLFGLTELLVPELARCAASGSRKRIGYLVQKSLRITLLYSLFFSGLEWLMAHALCCALYQSPEAGAMLKGYALLIPVLYCDAVTDAMTKGLGQQKICVRYSILTAALDVVFLYLLLPEYGLKGYFFSFALTHLLNFCLSLRLLLKITGVKLASAFPLWALPGTAAAALGAAAFPPSGAAAAYCLLLGSLWCLLNVTGREDIRWILGLFRKK